MQVAVREALVEQPKVELRLRNAQDTAETCRTWLESLPVGARVRPRLVDVDGHTLADVRTRRESLKAECEALRALPVPSPDIGGRVRDYVTSLAARSSSKAFGPVRRSRSSGLPDRSMRPS